MKKSWKRMAVIGAVALVLAAGLTVLAVFVVVPGVTKTAKYNQAATLEDKGDFAEAYDTLDRLGDFKDAQARKAKLQAGILASRSAQSMKFGGYDWLVLEERGGKALLLLRDTLAPRPYNEALADTTWEACTLRQWLNSSFYGGLPQADQARVVETAVSNRDGAEYGTAGGGDTRDRVFLLSLAEAKLYFPTDAARVARGIGGVNAWWWLRSPGQEPMLAAIVKSNGELGYAGSDVSTYNRDVRPAMWVTMEK